MRFLVVVDQTFADFLSFNLNMSSSMGIPTRSAYGESSKAVGSSSSSASSYSSSPQTPQQQKSTSPDSSAKQSGHNRRPSLLSKSFTKIDSIRRQRSCCRLRVRSHVRQTAKLQYLREKHLSHDAYMFIGSSFTKQEHTVVNIGDPDGDTLRLVSRGL